MMPQSPTPLYPPDAPMRSESRSTSAHDSLGASDSRPPVGFVFTSESVSEGHPDKVCDLIADSVLDAHLEQDPRSRVACEVLAKGGRVVIAGEISTNATVDLEAIARQAIRSIGYTDPLSSFNSASVRIDTIVTRQAGEIAAGVEFGGAGDQGLMFGYASDESPELMPLPIQLAHALSCRLAEDRRRSDPGWLRPDAKTQVSVRYREGEPVGVETVVVSTQHSPEMRQSEIHEYCRARLLPSALGRWHRDDIELIVNPTGSFTVGGPEGDAGVTGRKIIVDTYGGRARHGGGAFSGKDATKVDRSAAYFCRWVARELVAAGNARRAEVQVAYAIGREQPVSVLVDTFGTGDARAAAAVVRALDFRPEAIIERFGLRRPIFRSTTNYGRFGRPGLPWEGDTPQLAAADEVPR